MEFLKRLLVTLIGVPLSVWLIYTGGPIFFLVILLISSVTLWEYYRLCRIKLLNPFTSVGIILHLLFFTFIFVSVGNDFNAIRFEVLIALFSLFALVALTAGLYLKTESIILSITSTLSGLLYISSPFAVMIILRNLFNEYKLLTYFADKGIQLNDEWTASLIMTIFISVWICDTFAYLVGMAIGKHKLMPSVSPKKTWEGAIGGFIGAILSFSVSAYFLLPGFGLANSIILGAIIGVIGQIGDLAESKIKRDAGVKDSSEIIPGHGGLLDRFDSILFVVPTVFIYLLILILI